MQSRSSKKGLQPAPLSHRIVILPRLLQCRSLCRREGKDASPSTSDPQRTVSRETMQRSAKAILCRAISCGVRREERKDCRRAIGCHSTESKLQRDFVPLAREWGVWPGKGCSPDIALNPRDVLRAESMNCLRAEEQFWAQKVNKIAPILLIFFSYSTVASTGRNIHANGSRSSHGDRRVSASLPTRPMQRGSQHDFSLVPHLCCADLLLRTRGNGFELFSLFGSVPQPNSPGGSSTSFAS